MRFTKIHLGPDSQLTHPDMLVPNNPLKPSRGKHVMLGGVMVVTAGVLIVLRLIEVKDNRYD